MKKKHFLFISIAVIVVVLILVNIRARRERALPVQAEKVTARDITMMISASGSIRPKRQVDISASSIGKVTRVAVHEGDRVEKGQFLIQIDPVELESTVARLEAMLKASIANEKQAAAQAEQAKIDYERTETLFSGGYRTSQEVDAARTNLEVAISRFDAIRHEIEQVRANLEAARHSLREVTITSPMSGLVTRRNVEEGEVAIMGTLNNPGTVLLTVADLSTIEAEVEVDETEVTSISLGDPAKVTLDAFPDTSFAGSVTEIGNSPIIAAVNPSQQGVDFKVVITIDSTVPNVRPGLSADAEITVASAKGAPTIPIQSLTARRRRDLKKRTPTPGDTTCVDTTDAAGASNGVPDDEEEIEGVFVVADGRAEFRSVTVGISSQKYFEVTQGLELGEMVITGNFKAIREVRDGQRVKITEKLEKGLK
jgi:HlyD family secretion protein